MSATEWIPSENSAELLLKNAAVNLNPAITTSAKIATITAVGHFALVAEVVLKHAMPRAGDGVDYAVPAFNSLDVVSFSRERSFRASWFLPVDRRPCGPESEFVHTTHRWSGSSVAVGSGALGREIPKYRDFQFVEFVLQRQPAIRPTCG